jgi:hypothetical protein
LGEKSEEKISFLALVASNVVTYFLTRKIFRILPRKYNNHYYEDYEEVIRIPNKTARRKTNMNSKIKKIFELGVMVSMTFGFFTGCEKNKVIPFDFGDIGNFSTEALDEPPTVTKLIKSSDELKLFCEESGIVYKGEKYDETFFNDSALLIYFFVNESSMIGIQIDSLTVDNETLTINITRRVPRGGYIDEEQYLSYAFEIKQDDAADINNINVSKKDINK